MASIEAITKNLLDSFKSRSPDETFVIGSIPLNNRVASNVLADDTLRNVFLYKNIYPYLQAYGVDSTWSISTTIPEGKNAEYVCLIHDTNPYESLNISL